MLANSLRRATAAAGITIVNSTIAESATTGSTSMSITVPADTLNGDILLLIGYCNDGRDTTVTGFTEQRNQTANQPSLYVGTRTASSEPASYTLSYSSTTGGLAVMIAIRSATLQSVGTIVSTLNDGSNAVANTIEAVADDSLVIFTCGSRNGATNAIPTGFTNLQAQQAAASSRPNGRVDYEVVATGFTGSITSVTTGTSRKDAVAIMFTPA